MAENIDETIKLVEAGLASLEKKYISLYGNAEQFNLIRSIAACEASLALLGYAKRLKG